MTPGPSSARPPDLTAPCDPDYAGTTLHEAPQETGPVAREQQRRKNSGHEEDEGVQQGENPESSGRLVQQISREARRDPPAAGPPGSGA
jgi:hypothetical protein